MAKRSKVARREEKRAVREREVHEQRSRAKAARRNKLIINWGIVVVAVLFIGFLVNGLVSRPSIYTEFAACTAEAGAVMYGTDWCGYCQEQKRLFGRAFKEVNFENCDFSEECALNGVQGFPTWIFPDGTRDTGVQQLDVIAEKTGCALPS